MGALGKPNPTLIKFAPVERKVREFRGALRFEPAHSEAPTAEIKGLLFSYSVRGRVATISASAGPFDFRCTFSSSEAPESSKAEYAWSFTIDGATPRHLADCLALEQAMAQGGKFVVCDYDTGSEDPLGLLPEAPERVPAEWIKSFVEDLLSIQKVLGTKIKLGANISDKDVEVAHEVAGLLQNRNPYPGRGFVASYTNRHLKDLLNVQWPVSLYVWAGSSSYSLLGLTVTLPARLTLIPKATLGEAESERLKNLNGLDPDDSTNVIIVPEDGIVNFYFKGLSDGYWSGLRPAYTRYELSSGIAQLGVL